MASWSPLAGLASPRGNRYSSGDDRQICLHLYSLSGEFVVEDVVPIFTCVERYGQNLEEGLVTPLLGIEHGDFETDPTFFYELVWNGMVLECGRKLEDLVVDHGMSVDEPVDVMVIMKDHKVSSFMSWHPSRRGPADEGDDALGSSQSP